jgi:uncharacterized protein YjbI with pentapeptide repeats
MIIIFSISCKCGLLNAVFPAGANFSGADMTNATVESVDFEGADLTDAVLSGVQVY